MLSPLHLGGRNYTCTEIKLSKILILFAPYPPPGVNLWFQGNGSHLEAVVRHSLTLPTASNLFFHSGSPPFHCFVKIVGPVIIWNSCHGLEFQHFGWICLPWKKPVRYGVHEYIPRICRWIHGYRKQVKLAKAVRARRATCLSVASSSGALRFHDVHVRWQEPISLTGPYGTVPHAPLQLYLYPYWSLPVAEEKIVR